MDGSEQVAVVVLSVLVELPSSWSTQSRQALSCGNASIFVKLLVSIGIYGAPSH